MFDDATATAAHADRLARAPAMLTSALSVVVVPCSPPRAVLSGLLAWPATRGSRPGMR